MENMKRNSLEKKVSVKNHAKAGLRNYHNACKVKKVKDRSTNNVDNLLLTFLLSPIIFLAKLDNYLELTCENR